MIHVRVTKPSSTSKLGITMHSDDSSRIIVSRLKPNSLCAGTGLRPGMQIVRINQHEMTGLSPLDAAIMMNQASGQVDIWALPIQYQCFIITAKANPGVSAGIKIKHDNETGEYVIKSIATRSPFHSTLLTEEMRVLSINCHLIAGMRKSFKAEKSFISAALKEHGLSGHYILVVEALPNIRVKEKVTQATVYKQSVDDILGISLAEVPFTARDSVTVISKISPTSPFRNSELEVGMTLQKINHHDVSRMGPEASKDLLREAQGDITLHASLIVPREEQPLAHTEPIAATQAEPAATAVPEASAVPEAGVTFHTTSSTSLVQVLVMKENDEDDLGWVLDMDETGNVYVKDLEVSSPFSSQGLSKGTKVRRINGARITGRGMSFVLMLLESIVGLVSIDVEAIAPRAENPETNASDGTEWC